MLTITIVVVARQREDRQWLEACCKSGMRIIVILLAVAAVAGAIFKYNQGRDAVSVEKRLTRPADQRA